MFALVMLFIGYCLYRIVSVNRRIRASKTKANDRKVLEAKTDKSRSKDSFLIGTSCACDSALHSFGEEEITAQHDMGLINPATGLPMIGGAAGIDVEGNLYGSDMSDIGIHTTSGDSFDSIGGGHDPFNNY